MICLRLRFVLEQNLSPSFHTATTRFRLELFTKQRPKIDLTLRTNVEILVIKSSYKTEDHTKLKIILIHSPRKTRKLKKNDQFKDHFAKLLNTCFELTLLHKSVVIFIFKAEIP